MQDPSLEYLIMYNCFVSRYKGAIKYLVDGVGGKSCDEVCQGQGFVCKGTDHGMPSNVVATFKAAGVDCQFDEFDTSKDNWFHSADPKYGIGGLDDQVCRGFKNVPNEIKCDAKPTGNYGRLCPCIVGKLACHGIIVSLYSG